MKNKLQQHTHTGNKQTKKINDNRFTLHTHLIIDFERKKKSDYQFIDDDSVD